MKLIKREIRIRFLSNSSLANTSTYTWSGVEKEFIGLVLLVAFLQSVNISLNQRTDVNLEFSTPSGTFPQTLKIRTKLKINVKFSSDLVYPNIWYS